MSTDKTPEHIRLDERNHVERPLLEQLHGLDWKIIDLTDRKQLPHDTGRETFTQVVMLPVLRERLKVINPWLEDYQVEEAVKQLTASFPGSSLIENNRHLLHLLLENTSVSENRHTGEKSPTVRFVDFKHRDNNSFTAVCQFKVRIYEWSTRFPQKLDAESQAIIAQWHGRPDRTLVDDGKELGYLPIAEFVKLTETYEFSKDGWGCDKVTGRRSHFRVDGAAGGPIAALKIGFDHMYLVASGGHREQRVMATQAEAPITSFRHSSRPLSMASSSARLDTNPPATPISLDES